jgi:hypothetical protein
MSRLTTAAFVLGLWVLAGCGGGSGGDVPPGAPFTFRAATLVIGQPDFTSMDSDHGSPPAAANGLSNPRDIAVSGSFTLVADESNSRILGFVGAVQTNDPTADFVVGQSDFAGESPSVDNDRLAFPSSVELDGPRVVVADSNNHRVLVWSAVPQAGEGADVVLGQPDFLSSTAGSGPQGMHSPNAVCVAGGRLFVADSQNHRVLVWNAIPAASSLPADYALGQPDLTSNADSATASGMRLPGALWSDGTRLVVCDRGHARVLIWNTLPTTSGAPADVVVGQPDFVTAVKGSGPDGFSSISGVASDGSRLFVSDGNLSRILVFSPFPAANGAAAVAVLGQSDFQHTEMNDDDQDGFADGAPSARTLAAPAKMAIFAGRLYVADFFNHRVLGFDL